LDTPTKQEPITLLKDQHIVGDFLAHFEYTFHFRSHAMHTNLCFAKTQKLSMLLTLHGNHHYRNGGKQQVCPYLHLHLEGTKCLPCDDHAKLQLVERKEALVSDPKKLLLLPTTHP
jgi:hypothetical protein